MHSTVLPRLVLLGLALTASGCAVRSVYVKPDFATTDRFQLKRIAVAATPLPSAPLEAAALLARIARRYVHQHKDYLALGDGVLPGAEGWRALCTGGVQGVARVMASTATIEGGDLTLDMTADLRRCDSGVEVWRVVIRDTSEQADADLRELASVYRREFGDVADRYAAPLFVAVQTAFESLPSPVLTEEETTEKISLDE